VNKGAVRRHVLVNLEELVDHERFLAVFGFLFLFIHVIGDSTHLL